MISYAAAVECVRTMGEVRQFELTKRLGIDWRVANVLLKRMQHDGFVGPMDARGWRTVSASNRAAHAPDPVNASLSTVRDDVSQDQRFAAVRRLIVKELHPDSCRAQGRDKELMTEMFKRIWPQVQELSHSLA